MFEKKIHTFEIFFIPFGIFFILLKLFSYRANFFHTFIQKFHTFYKLFHTLQFVSYLWICFRTVQSFSYLFLWTANFILIYLIFKPITWHFIPCAWYFIPSNNVSYSRNKFHTHLILRERWCCLLVLNSVTSTLQCIRQPRPFVYLKEGTYHTRLFRGPSTNGMKK